MCNQVKIRSLFVLMILFSLTQNVFGGSMSRLPYSKVKNPEKLFEFNLKLYNRKTLGELIPSIKPLPSSRDNFSKKQQIGVRGRSNNSKGLIDKVSLGSSYNDIVDIANLNLDGSQEKYIYGTIKYKDESDYRVDTLVRLTIYSSNNPNLHVNDVFIRGVGVRELYFLVYAGSPVMDTSDEEAVLNIEIVDASAK